MDLLEQHPRGAVTQLDDHARIELVAIAGPVLGGCFLCNFIEAHTLDAGETAPVELFVHQGFIDTSISKICAPW